MLQEDQAERDMLVVGRLHIAAQLVGRLPEVRLEPEIGAIAVLLVVRRSPRHDVFALVKATFTGRIVHFTPVY